jgi:iron complex outermembrane recepter protein
MLVVRAIQFHRCSLHHLHLLGGVSNLTILDLEVDDVTAGANDRLSEDQHNQFTKRRAHSLIGTALLLVDLSASAANAQSNVALPAVTVDAPTQKRKPVRAAGTSARRQQAISDRRQVADRRPPAPSPLAAAAAAQYEAKLGYRATPSSTTLRTGASPLDTSQAVNVVPAQVLTDQLPRNLDDALVNVSGITQTNTLASAQDATACRWFRAAA